MDCVTNISQIEKIYCNSYNHDVKAPVVYADEDMRLYADAELTKPVDYKLLKDLFFAGVVIYLTSKLCVRSTAIFENGDDIQLRAGDENRCCGYDVENDEWYFHQAE